MNFTKYNSIENSYRQKFIDKILLEIPRHTRYVVTEKIHGSNFQFVTDGIIVKAAKRSGFIGENEKFYNYKRPFEMYKDNVLKMFDLCCEEGDTLRVAGELFGNGVQKNVFYSEEQNFMAFDIFINDVPVDHDYFIALCSYMEVPTVPVLGKKLSLEEALETPCEFDSIVGGIEDNIGEGTVIKPMFPKFLRNGTRVILKNKTKKFSERKNKSPAKVAAPLNDSEQTALDGFLAYINDNRVNAVISKIGEITQKDFGKILGLTIQDALEDHNKDNDEIGKDVWKVIKGHVNREAAAVVRESFVQAL